MTAQNYDEFEPTPLMEGLGLVRVEFVDPAGHARLEYRVEEHHCHRVAQGGYVTAWIDSAMARAVHGATNGELGCNTLEIKVSFYQPAQREQQVFAEASVERLGRSVAFLSGRLLDAGGELLAVATSTARLSTRVGPKALATASATNS